MVRGIFVCFMCSEYEGSCDFPLLQQWIKTNSCPSFFKEYNVPCKCPFPAQRIATKDKVVVDLSSFKERLPAWLIEVSQFVVFILLCYYHMLYITVTCHIIIICYILLLHVIYYYMLYITVTCQILLLYAIYYCYMSNIIIICYILLLHVIYYYMLYITVTCHILLYAIYYCYMSYIIIICYILLLHVIYYYML